MWKTLVESRFTPGRPWTAACISHRITDVEKTAPSLGGRRWASSSQSPLSPLSPQAAKAARAPLLSSEPPVILSFSPVILSSFPVILSDSEGSVPPPFMQCWGRRTDSSACGLRMTREQSQWGLGGLARRGPLFQAAGDDLGHLHARRPGLGLVVAKSVFSASTTGGESCVRSPAVIRAPCHPALFPCHPERQRRIRPPLPSRSVGGERRILRPAASE